ncbi:MAG TPA: alpha-amylase family glycosyl hydrolase [Tepidisphaeraceae bacterium]|nr:alpha-amylase family glycosyl hydrolase [Tepidisphaeraceae bacterium]
MPTEIESTAPTSLELANLQARGPVHPSPENWDSQILYFFLPDRFSDGREEERPLFDFNNPEQFRAHDRKAWMEAGRNFQGGTLKGARTKLAYLKSLGVTALWIGPVWKQRADLPSYHGYGIQNFLDVDPRFGTRHDLRDLVDAAHEQGIYVILDIIFNHTGNNWFYDNNGQPAETMPYQEGEYPMHGWRSREGRSISRIEGLEDGVWPQEFQNPDWYTRAGEIKNWDDPQKMDSPEAEFRRGDFGSLKDLKLEKSECLDACVRVYEYWIALSDCDGFRIDTVKHMPREISAIFCHDIRTFARRLGKTNFLLLGEVTGSPEIVRKYVDPTGPNLDAALDIESAPGRLEMMVKGLAPPEEFFCHFGGRDELGIVRAMGKHHVTVIDDHDMVWKLTKHRFAWHNNAADPLAQTSHAVGAQLTTPGIPCIYYGTEQAFVGAEADHDESIEPRSADGRIPEADRYIREAMFGGSFGSYVTGGCHFFNEAHPTFQRVAAIARLRNRSDHVGRCLQSGSLHIRETRVLGGEFTPPKQGELLAWARVHEVDSVLVALNTHGTEPRGADVTVDANLHPAGSTMTILYRGDWDANQLRNPPTDQTVTVQQQPDGRAYVHIDLPPAGMAILA